MDTASQDRSREGAPVNGAEPVGACGAYEYFVEPGDGTRQRPKALWRRQDRRWQFWSPLDWSWHTADADDPHVPPVEQLEPATTARATELQDDRDMWIDYWARYAPWYDVDPPDPAQAVSVVRQRESPRCRLSEQLTCDGSWRATALLLERELGNRSRQPRLAPVDAATAAHTVARLRSHGRGCDRPDRDRGRTAWVGTGAEEHLYLTCYEDRAVQRLHEGACARAERFDALLGAVAEACGGTLADDDATGVTHTVKDLDTLRRRVSESLSLGCTLLEAALDVVDYNRYTLLFDVDVYTPRVRQAGQMLERDLVLSHVRNRWQDARWRGHITWWHDQTVSHPILDPGLSSPSIGSPIELQFHTPQSRQQQLEDVIVYRGVLAQALGRHEHLLQTRAGDPMTLWRDGPDGLQYLSLLDWTWRRAGTESEWAVPRRGEWRWVSSEQAQRLAADRQHWVTYYARYQPGRDEPTGVLRERNVPDLLVEQYIDAQGWQPTTVLYTSDGANGRPRFERITSTEAERILHMLHGRQGLTRLRRRPARAVPAGAAVARLPGTVGAEDANG